VMGDPDSVSAASGVEYLRYDLYPPPPYYTAASKTPYFVRLIGGRVDSYGKLGDFNSTKDPTLRLILENGN